ncbi:MAG: tetratricopeptide repeat protein [bacterium]|nr:tetratricopeptide repeat protein [bacterium]
MRIINTNIRQNTALAAGLIICLMVLLPGSLLAEDDERQILQAQIESGKNLNSRAQKTLFASRSKQDRGDHEAAAGVMGRWVADHPDQQHHLLSFNWAVSQMALGQPELALKNLETAVTLEPRFARAWLRLGEAAYELGKYSQAGQAFARGYQYMPNAQPEILYYSSVAWLLADKPEQAIEGFEVLLKNHRETATVDWYQAMVAAASETERPDDAKPWLENCLSDNASDPDAWYLAYQFAASSMDYERASVCLTVVGFLRPLERDEFLQLGDLFANCGVPLQAARNYEKAVKYPKSVAPADDLIRLASAWMAAHKNEKARKVLHSAVARNETAKLWALLGDLNYSEENYKDARGAFERCVELDPQYGRGWLMSGYCSMEMDEPAMARQHLEKAAGFSDQRQMAQNLLKRID